MSRKTKLVIGAILAAALIFLSVYYFSRVDIPVLDPAGPVGQKERGLIILAVVLSLIAVIPVYFMLVFFAWKYREGNKKAKYDPHFNNSRLIESIWWGVPLIIIAVLAVATYKSSHDLDPLKPLASAKQPMTIQVVALQWQWLFIYPKEGIATTNVVRFPEKTPVEFNVTSDAPMNSFWIPELGNQIYAMSGMSTKVNLMANGVGSYNGSSANISGEGFADMTFLANSVSEADFSDWVEIVKHYPESLTLAGYSQLARPAKNQPPRYFSSIDADLYHRVVNKYLEPS
jgi:cytochrome o ubiquinol oxidase subunit 2